MAQVYAEGQAYEEWFESPFGRRADRVERRILSELLGDVGVSATLLDVGSGTGHLSNLWAAHGVRAVGVDSSLNRLRYSWQRHPGFPVILARAGHLPFRAATFDVVTIATVLEFLPSPEKALQEAGRVARKGLVLGVLNSLSPVALWRRARRSRPYRGTRFYSPWSLERLVRRSLDGHRLSVRVRTGLYPLPWMDGVTGLPFGAFIGMGVRFS